MLSLCAACGGELSEDDVLKKLAPSMVTIQFRDRDIGSGLLVEGNYIVTAAHVVWGLPEIDVVFKDGTEHGGRFRRRLRLLCRSRIPRACRHPRRRPWSLREADSLAAEDTVFNVGNPKQLGGLAVTKGEFTRTLEWPEADVTFVLSSAVGKPGMSGGIIANERGEVIGVHARRP